MSKFNELAKVLFDGEVIAADFKTMPGPEADLSRDHMAKSLLESMERMKLVENGRLVDPNR